MAKQFSHLIDEHRQFIKAQHIFFVGTADKEGRVNVSPKGMDSLRILADNRIIWLNYTGSGNESAAHLLGVNRMTLMFCSFEKKPLILRVYGKGQVIYRRDRKWVEYADQFPESYGSRQIFDVDIDLVQTSCGFGVPFFDYTGERHTLEKWADKRGIEGIEAYWKEYNQKSLDGKDTGILLE
ncbi:MAG: pyridoxamine 5'-phosphate oxidase family protein [Methylococcaceae bacterium]